MTSSGRLSAAALLALLSSILVSSLSCGDSEGDPAAKKPPKKKKPAYDGRVLYERFCLSCHGKDGRGDGVSATMLTIKPRDFSKGIFKFKSNREGLPSDADLHRTIKKGVGGTEMSGYATMPDEAIQTMVDYVKKLTVGKITIDDEDDLEYIDGVEGTVTEDGQLYALVNWFKMRGVGEPIEVPEPPPVTQELIDLGKSLFTGKAACVKCHGETGLGDGPSAAELKDSWGFSIKPRNFTTDLFKGGSDPKDIYLRVLLGIPGTPMPESFDLLDAPNEVWALVYYIKKLENPGWSR